MGSRRLRGLLVLAWCTLLAGVLWIIPVDGDDAYHHSVMAVEQLKCWHHGIVWPRFHPDWNGGTGSFLPAVYSPIVLTLDAGLLRITGEASRAVSISLVLALLTALLLLGRGMKERGSAGWMLVVAPYLLLNILARATPTEMWALAGVAGVLPILLPPGTVTWREGAVLPLLAAFTVGCQPIMLILVAIPLAAAWLAVWVLDGRGGWMRTLAWSVTMVISSAIFWLPPYLLIEGFDRASIFSGAYGWRGHFVTNVMANGELGPALLATWVALAVTVTTVAVALRRSMTAEIRGKLVFAGACLVLATPLSLPLWLVPGLGLVQFPWRFLGPASLAAALLLGHVRGRTRRVLAAVFLVSLAVVPVELGMPYPPLTPGLSRQGLETASAVRYGIAPVLPSTPGEYAPGFHPLKSLAALRAQGATAAGPVDGCGFPRVFHVKTKTGGPFLLPLQWWPELVVRSGGGTLDYENVEGLVTVRLPAGQHRISVSLLPPNSRRIGAVISLVGLILAGALCIVSKRRGEGPDPRIPAAVEREPGNRF